MIYSIHKIYLLKKFSKKIFLISFIFFALVLIINLIEEANFLGEYNASISLSIILTLLNGPFLLYEMFPFIFLISTQFFFIDLFQNKEIYTFRQFGLSNLNLMKFISIISLIYGLFIIVFFYNFSATLKKEYLKIKNKYADDNKYLAVITKNGLWIKDITEDEITIINADKIDNNFLINASLSQFDKDYKFIKSIIAEKINTQDFNWLLYNTTITYNNNFSEKSDTTSFKSNFNSKKINNLFSELSSLNYYELQNLKNDYKSIGYSIKEIEVQNHKIYSLPILLMLMTIIATIIMFKNKFKKNLLLNLFLGIFISVLVYYISHFSSLLGENGKLPIILSIWLPVFILFIISLIGIVKINEK